MERITGPWGRLYVAAYTTELDGLFFGYAKLFAVQPSDVWDSGAIMKISTRSGHVGEAIALGAVEARALKVALEVRAQIEKQAAAAAEAKTVCAAG